MADEPRPGRGEALAELTAQALGSLSEGVVTVSDQTRSMAPLLQGGERLRWRRPAGTPRRGELVVFAGAPGLVVHRVVRRRAGVLTTKGDARPAADVEHVATSAVIGVVDAIETGAAVTSLRGGGARFYAALATAISLGGAGLYRVAALGDGALRRLLLRREGRAWLRRPAGWVQFGLQALLHALLFRACHRRAAFAAALPEKSR
ncbi:MAG: hypothetical protein KBD01_15565 [Acidobacteria bacterium]|nr:hypothetical protein [Acidobacteriota bacterium]